MKHKRVFWVLIGNENTGSSRIHGHKVHQALLRKGIKSKILKQGNSTLTLKKKIWMLLFLKKGDLLILQKRKELSLRKLLSLLKFKRVNIAFIDCDLPKCDDSLVKYFDYIIGTSKNLFQLYQRHHPQKKVRYIPDAVEYFEKKKYIHNKKAIFFGWLTESRIEKINSLKKLFESLGWEIHTMSNNPQADIKWNDWKKIETFEIISQYSASLIAVDDDMLSKYKSSNRVLQSLAVGNIVLCSDIEAYREVIVEGENGFICSSALEWKNALNQISDQNKRNKIIERGYETAQNYTMDKVILKWIYYLEL
ncbi:glycosyltransferase [Psychroflexus gondwanensis ACAM 44]|jgi:glycosyltransferase involved in cell wall biosynthesis|uniref:Glycosyltransferase n=1 Tax=Psychroflexus gondwanensis ACAM 44 TaxID=1189619 RepID=N1WKN6_9FLAO|nr:glycosyltransferase [Psychroflexus gondwanensis]EMY80811.1 glycosyltransferase [Psychroflexus gondwanensis ACAM 44]